MCVNVCVCVWRADSTISHSLSHVRGLRPDTHTRHARHAATELQSCMHTFTLRAVDERDVCYFLNRGFIRNLDFPQSHPPSFLPSLPLLSHFVPYFYRLLRNPSSVLTHSHFNPPFPTFSSFCLLSFLRLLFFPPFLPSSYILLAFPLHSLPFSPLFHLHPPSEL